MIEGLQGMRELACPDCNSPVIFKWTATPEQPNNITFQGCRCEDKIWHLTETMAIAGFSGGPLFVYMKEDEPFPRFETKAP